MIKQGVVQEAIADINGPGALPPLNNLPQWSRVNTLDKARYPKPFMKDRLQPLPNPPPDRERQGSLESDDHELETSANANPAQRIHHLEKSINFLRSQHQEVLSNLHEEIDKLKRENKELQFRIVVLNKNSPKNSADKKSGKRSAKSQRATSSSSQRAREAAVQELVLQHDQDAFERRPSQEDEKLEELKIIFLEEEIRELKKSLRDEKNKNHYLGQLLEQAEKENQRQAKPVSAIPVVGGRQQSNKQNSAGATAQADDKTSKGADEPSDGETSGASTQRKVPSAEATVLPYNATLEPLLVHIPSQPPRAPNLKEVEVILKHMQHVNDKQAHELTQLKSDLRDVLYSHKWTPDAYLLAKAYIAEDDAKDMAEKEKLPRIPMKQPSRRLPDIAYIQKDTLSLPALRQTMGTKVAERRKRAQVLQKARLRREVFSASQLRES